MNRNFNFKSFSDALINPNDRTMHSFALNGNISRLQFICPQCGLLSTHKFITYQGFAINPLSNNELAALSSEEKKQINPALFGLTENTKSILNKNSLLVVSTCINCNKSSVWLETLKEETLLYPKQSQQVGAPNPDMPKEIKDIYVEASSIVDSSARAAAGLLRVATQDLINILVSKDDKLNDKIGYLVQHGVNPKVQQSLDILRVIGNESVHPGIIDLNDDKKTAYSLFEIMNYLVDQLISIPKKIKSIYSKLPESKLKAIENRDKVKKPDSMHNKEN
ncbi:MAG: DUF4145 domain-containing protein [Lentilactobacillus buchneri]|jgi:hypothetical protein|nr:DUF4145 domain-containing protein [Lentilactobacillus buchneri]MCI1951069.1 DUF4145 domain-containing protein [Lentilactobacillus buchneri]MCI2019504.1 DUF4145 domain-containing protein [Lentilactobacillus buchneri]MCI2028568.1 DUF4145 domain-containing protein [Lentilactobacillus buchneri]